MEQAGKILRIGLILFYPVMAILIWFLPMLENTPLWNKIGLSAALVLYGALRIYRLVRRKRYTEEEL